MHVIFVFKGYRAAREVHLLRTGRAGDSQGRRHQSRVLRQQRLAGDPRPTRQGRRHLG